MHIIAALIMGSADNGLLRLVFNTLLDCISVKIVGCMLLSMAYFGGLPEIFLSAGDIMSNLCCIF